MLIKFSCQSSVSYTLSRMSAPPASQRAGLSLLHSVDGKNTLRLSLIKSLEDCADAWKVGELQEQNL